MHELPHEPSERIRPRAVSPLLLGGALLLAACGGRIEASAHAAAPAQAPKVSVAQPLRASITEYSEHTGRAQAPESVEIRARASGHLVQVPFHDGQLVKKGDLLFVVDPRPYRSALTRARAELQSIRADRALAGKDLERFQELFRSSAIPERELDAQSTQVELLAARAEVVAANIASAELELDYAFVRSPIDGRIGRRLVTVGNLVGPSTPSPLATVVSVDPLYVYIDLEESRALELLGREPGPARVGFAGEDGYPHVATLDFVDNRVDPATGTLKLRVVVHNPEGRLSDGMFARVQLPRGAPHEALLVNDRALLADQDRRFVWVVGTDGRAQYRAINPGPLEQGLRVVRAGLEPGDRVIVRGLQRVRSGAAVESELISMRAVEERGRP
jgi:RND family efflux transporter MFP subunit